MTSPLEFQLSKRAALSVLTGIGAVLAGVLLVDVYQEWRLKGKMPLWSTIAKDTLPLLLALTVPAAGWRLAQKKRGQRHLSEAAKWVLIGCVGIVVAFGAVVEFQSLQGDLNPAIILVQLASFGAVGGLLVGCRIARLTQTRDEHRREEEGRPDTLFENLPIPALRCEVREREIPISAANEAFEAVFGANAIHVTGESLRDLLVPIGVRGEPAEIDPRALEDGRLRATVQQEDDTEARDLWLQVVGRGREEEPFEIYVLCTDITKQTERERRLERQNERLDSFAGVVSHDLRNPLNVAKGRLALAKEKKDPSHLDAVDRALERMDQIIEDVLTLTWGEQALEADDLDLLRLADLARACWEQVEAPGATLRVEDDLEVWAEEGRLQRLLDNLFRNAVEHGGAEVTVRIGALPGGFFVEDDGPGISAEMQEKVLQAGYSTDEEGTGLGLSIAQTIAETHGWTLSVAEGREGGARFEITGIEESEEDERKTA